MPERRKVTEKTEEIIGREKDKERKKRKEKEIFAKTSCGAERKREIFHKGKNGNTLGGEHVKDNVGDCAIEKTGEKGFKGIGEIARRQKKKPGIEAKPMGDAPVNLGKALFLVTDAAGEEA